MGAGSAAVEMFRNGKLPADTSEPPIVEEFDVPEANEPAKIADVEKDKRDTSEIPYQRLEATEVVSIRPTLDEAVTSTAPSEPPRYQETYQWILSEAPGSSGPTSRETLPKIAAYLLEHFKLPLSEAIRTYEDLAARRMQ
jgi:hypothetical protein